MPWFDPLLKINSDSEYYPRDKDSERFNVDIIISRLGWKVARVWRNYAQV